MKANYLRLFKIRNPEKAKKMSNSELKTAALELLNTTWGLPFESFFNVNFKAELRAPMDFQSWYPPKDNKKFQDFIRLKKAYQSHMFTPGVKSKWLAYLAEHKYKYEQTSMVFPVMGDSREKLKSLWRVFKAVYAPASPTIPYALRTAWYAFLNSEEVHEMLQLPLEAQFDIATYNEIAGTNYDDMKETPFPIPASALPKIQRVWRRYVQTAYPLRLTEVKDVPGKQEAFQRFLKEKIKILRVANELLQRNNTKWSQFVFPARPPQGLGAIEKNRRAVWKNFVKQLPVNERVITSSEIAYQKFLLAKYKSLDAVNQAYGLHLNHIEEAFPPFMQAYRKTFEQNEWAMTLYPIWGNYKVIIDYLFVNANAVPVTLVLVLLTLLCTLTINPLAAYSMSRFNLRGQDKIILFMLATMAFPAMVSAIPGYLLMRDLGLLNTFSS
jgi:ABC-type glycerol-3-phosphate transport system permease component